MKKNKLHHYLNLNKLNLEISVLILFFSSFLFSRLLNFNFVDVKIAVFDLLAFLFCFQIFKNIKLLKIDLFFNFLILLLIYIFLIYLIDILIDKNNLSSFLLKKKTLLFIQFLRSVSIFLISYIILFKINKVSGIKFLINFFTIYCIVILFLFFIDFYFLTSFVIEDVNRLEIDNFKNIRLRGFFADPNFLSLFSCFFLLLSTYLRLRHLYLFIFTLTIILSGSKTGYLYLLFQTSLYLLFFDYKKSFNKIDKIFKYLFFSLISIYFVFIIIDITFYFLPNDYIPKLRYYVIFDILNQKRIVMLKEFSSLEVNLLFGNGIYELTNYSKYRFNDFSHNSLFEIYYDFGLIGIILSIIFYIKLIKLNNKNLLQKEFLFFIGCFSLLLVIFLFNFTLFYLPFIWFFFAVIAIVINKEFYLVNK